MRQDYAGKQERLSSCQHETCTIATSCPRYVTARLFLVICVTQPGKEAFGVDLADHTLFVLLNPLCVEQHERGWPEQLIAVEQGALLRGAGGDVEAHQPITGERVDDLGVLQDLAFDDLAADAPVGVPVQQQWLACVARGEQFRIQLGRALDAQPLAVLQRTAPGAQRVGAAPLRTLDGGQ